jgi:hypothetical protein
MFMKKLSMVSGVAIVLTLLVWLGISGNRTKEGGDQRYKVTMDLAGQFGLLPVTNNAILVLAAVDSSQREMAANAFRGHVEGLGLTNFRRFILAETDTCRVIITYPEAEILRESK